MNKSKNVFHQNAVPALILSAIISTSPFLHAAQAYFKDATAALGLALGGRAAAWCDVDGDGWVDLCTGGKLWRNLKGKRFIAITEAPVGIFGDFNNDGYPDLFAWQSHSLHINQKGKGLQAVPFPKLPAKATQAAAWGDFDGDGFLDLYVGGYESWPRPSHPDVRLRNRLGKGKAAGQEAFEIVWTQPADGVSGFKGRTRGITCCDFDEDGDLDIYVSNYRQRANLLWRNDGKGGFTDAAHALGVSGDPKWKNGYGHTIGSAWGDLDNDGHIDLFAGNFNHHDNRISEDAKFYRNLGPDKGWRFEDKSGTAGLAWQESYASPALGDVDNDGDLDLFFTTVYAVGSWNIRNYPVLYANNGEWRFSDVTKQAGVSGLGPTYQAAWADFDQDGDLDLVSAGKLFVNQGNDNAWIEVRLTSRRPGVNRGAVGAQVRIALDGKTLVRQVEAGTGSGNQNDAVLHFGLGAHKKPVALDILWPDGKRQTTKPLALKKIHTIKQGG